MPSPAAVLYVPGINELAGSGVIDETAERIARTLDHQDEDAEVTYEVRVMPSEPYANGKAFTEVRHVLRCEQKQEPVVTHCVYHLAYHPSLAGGQPEHNLITKWLSVARVWAWMFVTFWRRVLRARSIGRQQKAAVFVGGAWLALLSLYLAVVLIAIVRAALDQVDADATLAGKLPDPPQFLATLWSNGGSWVSTIVVVAGLVGLTFESVRAKLQQAIDTFLRFSRYLDSGLGRSACTGNFNDLLEHIVEQSPSRLDVVAYSMGSLIALDAMFPSRGHPHGRTRHVTTLTTIGCPFDLVRTFWPDYFEARVVVNRSLEWINVYSPVDLLGSNFTNETFSSVVATRGINASDPKRETLLTTDETRMEAVMLPAQNLVYDHAGRRELDVVNAIFGGAYAAHSQYWVKGDTRAESCFNLLVPAVYPARA